VKRIIELLEQAEGCIMLAHAGASPADREELNRAINYLNEVMVELKKEAQGEKGD
jgi:flagellin-specific chaperone FliS